MERLATQMVFGNWSGRMRENNIVMRTFLLALVLATVSTTGIRADGIEVSQSLDRFSIPFEDSVHFDIVLRWDGPQSAYLFTKPLSPSFDRLKVRGFTSSIGSTGSGKDEVTTKRFRYTLIPTSSGAAGIDPVAISYISWPDSIPGELVTEAMTVQIAEPLPPVEEGGSSTMWIVIISLVAVGGLVAFILMKQFKAKQPKEIEKTPVEQFLDRLTVLKQEAGGDFKKFQAGLYKILEEFLATRYGINLDGTSDDDMDALLEQTNLNDSQKTQIGRWLVQARRDKFRPVVAAPGETVRLETEIRQFFEKL